MTKQITKRSLSIILALLLAVACSGLLPTSAAEIPDDAWISEERISVTIQTLDSAAIQEEICNLVGATVHSAYRMVDWEKNFRCWLVTFLLDEPGRTAVSEAIDRINLTYQDSETRVLAEPVYFGNIDNSEEDSSIPDDAWISEDTLSVSIYSGAEHPAEDDICTLIDAVKKNVTIWKDSEGEPISRFLVYTLNNPGREAVLAAIDLINETYKDSEVKILAEPNYLSEIDDPPALTVSDVVNLRQLIVTQTATADALAQYDYSGDGLLSVLDVVLMRQEILKG